MTEYNIEDLDHEEIYKLIKLGISVGRIPFEVKDHSVIDVLSSLDLIKDGKLKNAAMVLFAKNVMPTYSQCMLKMARFRGLSVTDDFIDNRQFYGNAFKILEEANDFMQRHLLIASYYQVDSFQRIDRPTLPVFAVREAMINAICHKNYMERSSAITIAIFDDRMEIWNCGLLPKELEIEDLMVRHKSYLRNKLIANAFYKKGFIESWGTGTVKIFDGCKEHGILPPIFEEYSGGISVTFMFAELIQRIGEIIIKPIVKQNNLAVNLSRRQQEIFSILDKFGENKLIEIIEKLKNSIPERTLRNDLSFLKKIGLIGSRGRGGNAIWFKI